MTFTYTGTSGNDNYFYQGSDSLLAYGLAGDDLISFDSVTPSDNATLIGGTGDDTLLSTGDYTLYSPSGGFLIGGAGDDLLDTQFGSKILIGGAGNDSLQGIGGNLILRGGTGNDLFYGYGVSNSTLIGGAGDDTLYGLEGNCHLIGGKGNDSLNSTGRNDTLTGGLGADIFDLDAIFPGGSTITDFRRVQGDKIDVPGSLSNYSLDQSQNLSGQPALDTAIYSGRFLVAVVQDNLNVSLSSDFI